MISYAPTWYHVSNIIKHDIYCYIITMIHILKSHISAWSHIKLYDIMTMISYMWMISWLDIPISWMISCILPMIPCLSYLISDEISWRTSKHTALSWLNPGLCCPLFQLQNHFGKSLLIHGKPVSRVAVTMHLEPSRRRIACPGVDSHYSQVVLG